MERIWVPGYGEPTANWNNWQSGFIWKENFNNWCKYVHILSIMNVSIMFNIIRVPLNVSWCKSAGPL